MVLWNGYIYLYILVVGWAKKMKILRIVLETKITERAVKDLHKNGFCPSKIEEGLYNTTSKKYKVKVKSVSVECN